MTGVDGTNDTPNWTPTTSDAGTLTITGLTINVLDTESLTVGGDADNEALTVNGNVGANVIVHTPGSAVDAGTLAVDSLLAISYVNLGATGTVTANGIGGADKLVALGTGGSDVINADFTGADAIDIDLASFLVVHVDLLTIDIDSYEIRSLEGDDTLNVQAPIQASGTFAVLGGGNGGGSDLLNLLGDTNAAAAELVRIEPDAASSSAQDITGLGTRIDSSGIERIRYAGNNTNDTLTVAFGLGDNEIRVDRGSGVDRVTSDSLPQIEFTGLNTFVADLAGGADVATFATAFLGGAIATNYRVLGEANDTLVIEGTDGAGNNFTLTDPDGIGGSSVRVRDNISTVVVTETAGALGRVQISTLGGDDTVTVDVGATDVIRVPITVDGGANSDLLVVRGTPLTALTNVTYSPGPATTDGRLQYANGGGTLMTIDFQNLEPVLDLVLAATLTINGTNNANVFNYTDGVITPGATVDAGNLRVDSLVPMDFLNIGAAGTVDLTDAAAARIDTFVYNGTGASDTFNVLATSGSVDLNNQVLVTTPGISRLVLNALEGDDATTISYPQPYNGSPDHITVNGGGPGGRDSLTVIGAAAAVDAFTVTPSTQPHNGAVLVNAVNNIYTGVEHLFLTGNAGDADTLLVNDDGRDNTWDVSAGTVGDLVQIAGRESIDFDDFCDVTLTNGLGTDLFRVRPTNLTGYTNSLTINGDATRVDDVLEVYGTPAADTVSTTANVITTNTRPVTAGVNLVELKILTLTGIDTATVALSVAGARNVIDLGAGNDTLTATTSSGVVVYAGEGDDSITASDAVDTIYGDAGNDTILALDGNDLVYAGTGNDSITGGVGNDFLFGGDGSDRFVWNNGDNSDTVEGDDGVDVQIVNGAAGGDIFNLRTATNNQTRSFFERTNLVPFTIDMGQIEQVDINGLAGTDQIAVRDLDTTEIRQVNVDVGAQAELDTVTVDGRTVSDTVTLTALATGVVNIAGLKYDVDVSNLNSTTDLDTLTVNAREGNDTVVASDGLNAIFGTTLVNVNHLTINGGEGDDSITGFGQLNGDAGADSLFGGNFAQSLSGGDGADSIQGSGGDDVLNGNAGENSFIGGLGNDTIDGGADWDAILINGTSGADVIEVNQTSATTVVERVNAITETDTLVLVAGVRTVEEARVDAGSGADTIRVRVTDSAGTNLIDATVNSLQMTIHGGDATGAGDRLIVVDDGPADHTRDDLTIYRKSQDDSAGSVTVGPGNPEAFENVFDGIERIQFVDGSGAAVSTEPGSTSRLVVFKHDPFEYNDDRFVATHIGANSVVNVDPTIDPGSVADPFGDGLAAQALDIFLDTQGPQVTNVQITAALSYDLFDPKPSLGPTPRTDALTISFRDFPIRTAAFPNPAINPIVGVNPGHYVLRGDANGVVAISSITFVGDPSIPG